MLDLTEVILNDGKVIHREVTLELTSLKYRFGDFQIQKATPVELTIENIGERKLSVNGKVHLTVCIPCARCLEPTASGRKEYFAGRTVKVCAAPVDRI